jgi:hypothetical protein
MFKDDVTKLFHEKIEDAIGKRERLARKLYGNKYNAEMAAGIISLEGAERLLNETFRELENRRI